MDSEVFINTTEEVISTVVDSSYKPVCSTCLSVDRNLVSLNDVSDLHDMYRLLMYDFASDEYSDTIAMIRQLICWECYAMLKKFHKFKQQVHIAQQHIRVLAFSSNSQNADHSYLSQSLSSLQMSMKTDFDKVYLDYLPEEPCAITNMPCVTDVPCNVTDVCTVPKVSCGMSYITINATEGVEQTVKNEEYDVLQVGDNINLNLSDSNILEVINKQVDVGGVGAGIVISGSQLMTLSSDALQRPEVAIEAITTDSGTIMVCTRKEKAEKKLKTVKKETMEEIGFITEYMTEQEMEASREELKQKVQYVSSLYKCELCIIGFYTQQQLEDHFVSYHKPKGSYEACKVCYKYFPLPKLSAHVDQHYMRRICNKCGHIESSGNLMKMHVKSHNSENEIGRRKSKNKREDRAPPKPGDLRKLLSKTTIEGYQCLECDMFFTTSRARKTHVARYHREGLQCDHCKKRFVNRTTLATHLKLHEGPPPREECPICHKMVRCVQIKYHIQRHQSKGSYECAECNKVFSHMATYQAHLKYARAHATEQVLKYPCPMCNKGYPTKEAMQDHFNYQHLGKTQHKCPICHKPIACKANVEKHMNRVHGQRKERPRKHVCQTCGKGFTDRKALNQHVVIHSGARPLSCDVCQQTFKQKASLYTHRKRVHKLFPQKRTVEFMDIKPDKDVICVDTQQ